MVIFGGLGASYLNDVWSLDLTTDTWSQVSTSGTSPSVRFGYAAVLYGHKMVIYGGSYSWPSGVLADVWTLNLLTDTWAEMTTFGASTPAGRAFLYAVLYGDEMIIYGGWSGSAYLGDAWSLDLTTSTWTSLSPVAGSGGSTPTARRIGISVLYGSSMLVYGGYTAAGQAPSCGLWTSPQCHTPGMRSRRQRAPRRPQHATDIPQCCMATRW